LETVGLVACGKRKLDVAAPAGDLYIGQLFRKASAYAEETYDRWFILSAKHGLLRPDEVIEPYDLSMAHLAADERRAWAAGVAEELDRLELMGSEFFFHAGSRYTSVLAPMLRRSTWPLQGLGIGRQLAWYHERGSRSRH